MRTIVFAVLCCLALITASLLLGNNTVAEDKSKTTSTVVATVDGAPVYQDEIEIRFLKEEASATEMEINRLEARIRQIIEESVIKELNIQATTAEIKAEVDSKFEQAGIDQAQADKIAEMYKVLVVALKKWHDNKSQSTEIYEEHLNKFMTQAQWQLWQESCPSAKELMPLKKQMPQSLDDMKRTSFQSSKRDVLYAKLVDHVTKNIRVQDNEVRAAYAERYQGVADKPSFPTVEEQLKAEVLARKRQLAMAEWWESRFRQANIHIVDKRTRDLWETRRQNSRVGSEQK